MTKQYYDHRCVKCPQCGWHREAGPRDTLGKTELWPEGCNRYGYSFSDRFPEDADDCEGFATPGQVRRIYENAGRQQSTKQRKTK